MTNKGMTISHTCGRATTVRSLEIKHATSTITTIPAEYISKKYHPSISEDLDDDMSVPATPGPAYSLVHITTK